ncbi:MAG: SUMF1/EgtB/PvdO family nonheme iron enzyme, partial [Candidatus Latescibacteria bacterium]|nr:SUMF1/EgtB/PvdO family nonheme iron enzyme [Candidatus Latescibacterota bacterium]
MVTRRLLLLIVLLVPASLHAQTATDVDYDASGVVDFPDFAFFARAFDAKTGQQAYNAACDLDGNGVIEFPDFAAFARLFGQTAAPNRPPVADAGPDQSVEKKETITLDGSDSSDPEGRQLQFQWNQVYGESVDLSDSTAAEPSFTAPGAGNYAFALRVSDGSLSSEPDTMIVNVVVLSESAVVIGSDESPLSYQSAVGDELTFAVTGTAAPVEVGDVLVNAQEPYFLKKVVSVTSQNGQHVTVKAEDAALTDVIEEASITATFRVGQPASFKLALPAEEDSSPTCGGVVEDQGLSTSFTNTTIHSDASASLTASGEVSFDPEYEFNIDIGFFKLKEFRFAARGDVRASMALTLAAQAAFELEADKTIAKVPALPYHVVIPAAGVPIVLGIQAEFGVGATFYSQVSGSVTSGVVLTKPVLLGTEYRDGNWEYLNNTEPVSWEIVGPEVQLTGAAGIQGYLRGQVNVMLYDAAGPYLGLKPYMGFDTSVDVLEKQLGWSLNAGLDAYVGAQVEFLGRELVDQRWDINIAQKDLKSGFLALQTYLISGTVTESDTGLSGVTLSLSGEESGSTTAASDGTYAFANLLDGSYTVTPSLTGHTFAPDSLNVTVSGADVTRQDFAATASTPSTGGDSLTVTLPAGSVEMAFVYISPGKFQMGSPSTETGRYDSEGPQHEVTISKGFYLGKYEVTQGQWQGVMGTTPWSGQSYVQVDADNPAVYVSWNDVQSFVQMLNDAAKDSLYRLPTEAEWEYACRAGTTERWSFGDDESKLKDYAWYYDNAWKAGEEYAHGVGTKLPNPWGLFDMHGNVWEWCLDWYDGSYSSDAQVDPLGPDSGPYHV